MYLCAKIGCLSKTKKNFLLEIFFSLTRIHFEIVLLNLSIKHKVKHTTQAAKQYSNNTINYKLMITKSLKLEILFLLLGVAILAAISIFNVTSLLYIPYVVLVGLYFFPGALVFVKEKMETSKLISMFVLCNTLFISYLITFLKDNNVMIAVGVLYLFLNLFFVFYFNVKNNKRFVLHLLAHFILVWAGLWL